MLPMGTARHSNRIGTATWHVFEIQVEGLHVQRHLWRLYEWTHLCTYWTPCMGHADLFVKHAQRNAQGGTWQRMRIVIEEWEWSYLSGEWQRQEYL